MATNANHSVGFDISPDGCLNNRLELHGGWLLRAGEWVRVPKQRLDLFTDAVQFVEIGPDGLVTRNLTGFTQDKNFLYVITTSDGKITAIQDWRNQSAGIRPATGTFPTSASGLSTGDVWSNSGVLTVV